MQVNANAASPMASASDTSSSKSSSSSSGGNNITASDFMTLLVAEMKNQDPTQPTDPSAYLQQLVSVNSLQQLISINQGITSLTSGTGSTDSSSSGN